MAEHIRENRIYYEDGKWIVYIDTNKSTYTKEFDNEDDAIEWQEDIEFYIYN
jgi:hypothetical protein